MNVRLSVVTICLNPGEALQRTVESIAALAGSMEWIVVDGGSTDGTQERLRALSRPPDRLLSERDSGIANAFNKGIALATGDAICFMNAGDEFAGPDALTGLVDRWERGRHRWIVGAGDIVKSDGTTLFRRAYARIPSDPLSLVRRNCRIMHQAVLCERSLFSEHGGYDETFRIAMDYELWVRWITCGIVPQMVDHPVCRFHPAGASGSPLANQRENRRLRELHGIGNGFIGENALLAIAWTKRLIGGRYGRWAYRFKERLGIRI